MKKQFLFGASAVLALGLASCSSDEPLQTGSSDGVTFTVNLPSSMGTRSAFADGLQADKLDVAVYDTDNNLIISQSESFGDKLSTQITIPLVKGQDYKIAFFAHQGNDYDFNAEEGTFTANYSQMVNDYNTSDHDAFFKLEIIENVQSGEAHAVTLTRPVAQLNWGTSDLSYPSVKGAYGENLENLTSKVTVKGVYTTFDMLENKVSGEAVTVEFAAMARPVSTDVLAVPDYPVEDYEYVSLQYLLVPETSSVVDATWTPMKNGEAQTEVVVSNCPVQANYRTNIYGALLTTPTDFNVTKEEGFSGMTNIGPDDKELDGVNGVRYNDNTKEYSILSFEGLEWLKNETNVKGNTFEGYTVKLYTDIDLQGKKWNEAIKVKGGNSFLGTFDGNGATIYNLTLKDMDADALGFFYNGRHVKSLNFNNANITGSYTVGVVTGHGICSRIENCHVDGGSVTCTPRLKNGVMDDGNNAGGIVGYLTAEPTAYVKNCSVKNFTVKAYRKVGGIVGYAGVYAHKSAILEGNTVENVSVIADMRTENYDNAATRKPQNGVLFGDYDSSYEVSNNTAINSGTTVIKLGKDTEVSTPSDLVAVVTAINNGQGGIFGNITLTSDIDATGYKTEGKWKSGTVNNITFDGGNHKISNLTMEGGFFASGASMNTVIKNITFENCKSVKGTADAVNGTAIVFPQLYGSITMENVHVNNCTVEGNFAVGALIGQLTNEGGNYTVTFKDCSVTNSSLTAFGNSKGAWIECEGVAGANAFIGASIVWYNANNTNTVVFEGTNTQSGNTFRNLGTTVGGGMWGQTLMYLEENRSTIFN